MDELIKALTRLLEAKQHHDSERKLCQEDWSYFGYREIEQLEDAEKEFADALNKVIDERVAIAKAEGR